METFVQICRFERQLLREILEDDRNDAWMGNGARSHAEFLAARYGIGQWKARRWIGAAYALEHLPLTAHALETGRLSIDQVVELTRFAIDDWRQRTSAAFQDFARLQLLARDSVGVGWLPGLDRGEAEAYALVAAAVDRAAAGGLHDVLPDGLGTMLGREFADGLELSIGQWQKVAIARAMMRTSPLLQVLDEPTASLDARAEYEIFARMKELTQGKMAFFISHRFSTVRLADRIFVLEGGKISEAGTHQELLALNGTYADLFKLQAAAYR